MANLLIKDRRIIEDAWQLVDATKAPDPSASVIVPRELWQAEHDRWLAHSGPLGVLLEPEDEARLIAEDLPRLQLVAIRFPVFTDGRGYSTARLLREKYGFTGEIRALGDVFKDVLFYLSRVGFDAFQLRAGEDGPDALLAFDTFSEAYQVSVERSSPLFRRRLEAHG